MVVSDCGGEQKAGSCNGRLEYVREQLNDPREQEAGSPATTQPNGPCAEHKMALMAA